MVGIAAYTRHAQEERNTRMSPCGTRRKARPVLRFISKAVEAAYIPCLDILPQEQQGGYLFSRTGARGVVVVVWSSVVDIPVETTALVVLLLIILTQLIM